MSIVILTAQVEAQGSIGLKLKTAPKSALSDVLKKHNLTSFGIKNLSLIKNEDPMTQMRAYSTAPNRGATPPAVSAHSPKSTQVNGITYSLQATPFATSEKIQSVGSPVSQTSTDGVRICEKVTSSQEEHLEIINNYGAAGNIAPGMIFGDQSVLNGTFMQQPVTKKAFSITTDLIDFSNVNLSNAQAVAAPYDLGAINNAVNGLLNRLKNSPIPARIYSDVYEVHASAQLKLSMESSASANLEALIDIPIDVSASQSFSNEEKFEVNRAVAVVVQPYFTISVASPPWELVNGAPPSDAVVVSNVIYGRMAIITATSTEASVDLKASLERAVGLVDVASGSVKGSAEVSSLLKAGSLKVRIIGGNAQNASAAAVGSFDEFKNFIKGIDPTVQGALGVPLAYMFRFVSDDAPVFIKGISQFDNVECRHAQRLKITNSSIKVTKVSDFGGDEELYGHIKLTLGNTSKNLWEQAASAPIKKGSNDVISINAEPEFRVDPELINTYKLSIEFRVRDKIESGPEWLGATNQGKHDGFVTYSPGTIELNVKDVQNANGGKLTKTYTLSESAAEVKVSMTFSLIE